MLPCPFTLGRLIILRVASLREERPEPLRRVRRGDWPCVIWRFHQVHPHPPPRPLSATALVSSQRLTCRQLPSKKKILIICHNDGHRGFVNGRVNMNSGGLKFSLRVETFFVREVPPLWFSTLP